jgi:hypothetical protein
MQLLLLHVIMLLPYANCVQMLPHEKMLLLLQLLLRCQRCCALTRSSSCCAVSGNTFFSLQQAAPGSSSSRAEHEPQHEQVFSGRICYLPQKSARCLQETAHAAPIAGSLQSTAVSPMGALPVQCCC